MAHEDAYSNTGFDPDHSNRPVRFVQIKPDQLEQDDIKQQGGAKEGMDNTIWRVFYPDDT